MPLRIKIFISLWWVALVLHAGVPDKIYVKADSIFARMSYSEKLKQSIWIKSEQQSVKNREVTFGTLLFAAPLTSAPQHSENHKVAVQLDERLNPIPNVILDLPSLDVLSSISDEALLSAYFHKLEQVGRSYGIDYMVLPDGEYSHQKFLLKKMAASSSNYFKQKHSLQFAQLKRRKDIQHVFLNKQYWVIKPQQINAVDKKLERIAQKIWQDDMSDHLLDELVLKLNEHQYQKQVSIPYLLQKELVEASTSAFQSDQILPLRQDTICMLTNEPYSSMAHMIGKYAYLKTSYADIAKSDAPIIIDRDAFIPPGILDDRKLVYAGSVEEIPDAKLSAALIYTGSGPIHDFMIPQQLFGVASVTGNLQSVKLKFLEAITYQKRESIAHGPLSMLGLEADQLEAIDDVIKEAIANFGTPGGQLAIVADGSLVLQKSFGYLTYDSLVPVDHHTLYDLASITKVAATLLAIMKLHEEGQIDLDAPISQYLPDYLNSNKSQISIKSLLAHQAGLKPYVPFWKKAITADHLETFYYETDEDLTNDNRSYGLKPNALLKDSLKNWIKESALLKYDSIPYYSYSDLGFMILHQVVEAIAMMPMDEFLMQEFYQPMGLTSMAFNPKDKGFDLFEIAPTEYDYYFRDELVWGEVHDRNSAVFGGVAGHAGLFSNAYDLVVLMQTLLFEGRYDGRQYLSKETIDLFNRQYFPANRRALGWDKKDDEIGNVSSYASDESFGHTGFTGTMVWVDPQYDLIFVFLSNRIHPNASNYQLIRRNIRTRIQDVVYEALLAKWMK